MTEIFLLRVRDASMVRDIVKEYPKTPAFAFIQDALLTRNWWPPVRDTNKLHLGEDIRRKLRALIDVAVRLNTAPR